MPPENVAPTNIPSPAIRRITLKEATFDPMAEFKKFTASLLTPTIKSETAKIKSTITITK